MQVGDTVNCIGRFKMVGIIEDISPRGTVTVKSLDLKCLRLVTTFDRIEPYESSEVKTSSEIFMEM